MSLSIALMAALVAAAPPPGGPPAATAAADSPRREADLTYADLADLVLSAPIVAKISTIDAIPVREAEAAGVRSGFARLYISADVTALIRAPGPLAARVAYLVDLPRDDRGRAPRIAKGTAFLVAAAPVAGRPGELRLIARDAQIPFTPAAADRLRAIAREATGSAPPPVVTGIGRAFYSPGNLPGESETQIFVQTADRRPVSLSILRRPGQAPRWAVALSEVVDESAVAPKPETLLWYRLACGLPRSLPAQSLEDPASADAIRRDYRLVLDSLGPCARGRTQG